jgi:hypothetical protein
VPAVRALAGLILFSLFACRNNSTPSSQPAAESALPTYEVHRATSPLTIDGTLAEAAWDRAQPVVLVRSIDGRAATWPTEARLLWDDDRLYAGFLCEDHDIQTPFTKDDDTLYTSNVVEIFVNPSGDLKRYFEIEVSPANALFDASFTGRRTGMELGWSSRAQHAVHLDGTLNDSRDRDRGWSAELAIPFGVFDDAKPQRGAVWRFNLYRLLQGPGQPNEGQAYSPPMVGDFHAVNRFAYLKFVD